MIELLIIVIYLLLGFLTLCVLKYIDKSIKNIGLFDCDKDLSVFVSAWVLLFWFVVHGGMIIIFLAHAINYSSDKIVEKLSKK